ESFLFLIGSEQVALSQWHQLVSAPFGPVSIDADGQPARQSTFALWHLVGRAMEGVQETSVTKAPVFDTSSGRFVPWIGALFKSEEESKLLFVNKTPCSLTLRIREEDKGPNSLFSSSTTHLLDQPVPPREFPPQPIADGNSIAIPPFSINLIQ
ncbi:MAG: hypothetical protein AAGH89_09810, partial [Verrucomicrobiota bacterium]